MGKLDGKVAVITGGGRGQGRSLALTFAREGADIVVCDIDFQIEGLPYEMNSPGDLAETKRLVESVGQRCLTVLADVRDAGQVVKVVEATLEEFGRLDIIVANAGAWWSAPVAKMTDLQWRTILDINLKGTFHAIRAAGPQMIEQKSGRIIVISSTLGRQGAPNLANEVASRWGQLGLVKTAAIELGPHNITVNAVCPTLTETAQVTNAARYRAIMPGMDNPTREAVEEFVSIRVHTLPTAWVQTQDVSEAVLFVASDEARFVTGTAIDVSAGRATNYAA
jgi:SDR family mycofactocin-dependent oxidoreductase